MDATASFAPRTAALALHWPEYIIEAALLALFMLSACAATVVIEHPASPLRATIAAPLSRRALIGVAMGLTAVALIYSPWGRQSGAHFNPAVTATYLRLGKIAPLDALGYVVAQCAGGALGMLAASAAFGMAVAHPAVAFVATVPGPSGVGVAFGAELAISFIMMTVILSLSNGPAARLTGLACGGLVAMYIAFEAPLSGMSMNPARTLASAVVGGRWTALWVYLSAPPLGMLAAAELFAGRHGLCRVRCAKLAHDHVHRCIFDCGYAAPREVSHG